jgi:hypothetical protein
MNCSFRRISLDNFLMADSQKIIFWESVYPNSYGILLAGEFEYYLSWNSDLDPEIKYWQNYNFITIGIDQHFAVLDVNRGNILFKCGLDSNFFKAEIKYLSLFVFCETFILLISKNLFSFERYLGVSDILNDWYFADGGLYYSSLEGIKSFESNLYPLDNSNSEIYINIRENS